MIARISIKNSYEVFQHTDRVERLREIFPDLPPIKLDTDGKIENRWDFSSAVDSMLVDLEESGPLLVAGGFEFEIKAFRSNYLAVLRSAVDRLVGEMKLVRQQIYNPETQVVAQVHMPNGFLHEVTEVQVLEDQCTNSLQEYLDDGWRILAVCPSIDQRRPDYIMGRAKKP